MKGGGEALSGGEGGERGRAAEREIGARVLGLQNEIGEGDDVLTQDKQPERLRQLDEEVFDKVDIVTALERTMKFVEKIDLDRLLGLREGLQEDLDLGMSRARDYFAEILELSLTPHLDTEKALYEKTLGGCVNGGEHADRIYVDVAKHKGDIDEMLGTLAHESWHSYQYDVLRKAKLAKDGAEMPDELVELAKLYDYNVKFYIKAELDYVGYCDQLYEVEARIFGALVKVELNKAKAKEKEKEEFLEAHPEVYGDENRVGIEREVDGVLHGFKVDEFLGKMGAENLSDFWGVDKDERLAKGYARALSELVGLDKPLDVEFEDELKDGKRARMNYKLGQLTINRQQMWNFQPLAKLPEIVWKMRQREVVRDDPEGERGELYRLNFDNYVQDKPKMYEAHKQQLLVREKDFFVKELLNIFDEQTLEDEIKTMSPEERKEIEEEKKSKGWEPVTSRKYEIRRG